MSKIRAKKVYKEILGNRGKALPMSKAMIAAGYSPSYAKNPKQFMNTKSAQELEQKYLPDELIAERHHELLNAADIQHYNFPRLHYTKTKQRGKTKIDKNELTNEEIKEIVESVPGCRLIYVKRDWLGAWAFYQVPDHRSREKAIDMAYKRKGDYAPDKIQLVKRKYQDLSNAELAKLERTLKDFLLKR